jgi:prepilin-type N-terminal cleavage/methylation domain-containing protein
MSATKRRSDAATKRQRSRPIRRAPSHHHHAGFTLIEMVVVIGIIVLLAALTIGVVSALTRGSETRTTENALHLLTMAYDEWKTTSERDLSYGIDDVPQAGVVYDIAQQAPNGSNEHEPTDELLDDIKANTQSRDILANIDDDLLKAPTAAHPDSAMLDAWGTEIVTVFPGRLWVQGFDAPALKDQDGTIRTEFENAFGVCTNRRVRFVSAGPDGRIGDMQLGLANPPADPDAADNIYSYPLEAP